MQAFHGEQYLADPAFELGKVNPGTIRIGKDAQEFLRRQTKEQHPLGRRAAQIGQCALLILIRHQPRLEVAVACGILRLRQEVQQRLIGIYEGGIAGLHQPQHGSYRIDRLTRDPYFAGGRGERRSAQRGS